MKLVTDNEFELFKELLKEKDNKSEKEETVLRDLNDASCGHNRKWKTLADDGVTILTSWCVDDVKHYFQQMYDEEIAAGDMEELSESDAKQILTLMASNYTCDNDYEIMHCWIDEYLLSKQPK
jgi:hypothetical protein